jgi:chromosome partitioning protein
VPIVATIRDSQNYVRAAQLGVGVHEMKSYVAQEDVEQWGPLTEWLETPRRPHAHVPSGAAATSGAPSSPPPQAAPASMPVQPATDAAAENEDEDRTQPLPAVAAL